MCGLIVEEVVNGCKTNRVGETNVIPRPRHSQRPAMFRPQEPSTSFQPSTYAIWCTSIPPIFGQLQLAWGFSVQSNQIRCKPPSGSLIRPQALNCSEILARAPPEE